MTMAEGQVYLRRVSPTFTPGYPLRMRAEVAFDNLLRTIGWEIRDNEQPIPDTITFKLENEGRDYRFIAECSMVTQPDVENDGA